MQYTRLGNTGMMVSRLALGTMTFGDKLDQAACQRITDEAIERGVNLIDTADVYGQSEALLGKVLKANGKRDRVFLCTKVHKRHSHGEKLGRLSRINILSAVDHSLRMLQVDHVDMFQLHHPDPETPVDETVMALDSVVKAGKTRYVGFSNHYAWQMAYTNAVAQRLRAEPLVSVQSAYNMLHRVLEVEMFPFVRKFNFGLMVYHPLGGGTLARQYDSGHAVETKGRPSEFKARLDKNGSDVFYRILDGLHAVARAQGLPIHQLAMLWLLAKPLISAVLLGGSKPEHFSTMYEIADKSLDPAVVKQLDDLTDPAIYVPYQNQPHTTAPGMARA
jgi:aryl-alcohol dehydrogenase-like predicted oxidoreductase